jgi:DNA-binding MarR family transcriptional regulator
MARMRQEQPHADQHLLGGRRHHPWQHHFNMTIKEVELTADERLRLREFLAAVDLFADLESNMPLQMLRTFVVVALNEGAGTVELAREAGLNASVMSRHIGDWTKTDRYGKPSHDFIEQHNNPTDRRNRLSFLTANGRSFLRRVPRMLRA